MKFPSVPTNLVQTATAITLGILPWQNSASAVSSPPILENESPLARPQLLVKNAEETAVLAETDTNDTALVDLSSTATTTNKRYTFSGNQRLNQLNNLAHQSSSALVVLEPSSPPSESTDIGTSNSSNLEAESDNSAIYIPVQPSAVDESSSLAIPIQIEENYTETSEVSLTTESDNSTISHSIPVTVDSTAEQKLVNLSDFEQQNYATKIEVEKPRLIDEIPNKTSIGEHQELVSVVRETEKSYPEENFPSMESNSNQSTSQNLVTSVPIQVDYYNPTVTPSPGAIVSPDLPQLYSPEQYLPEGERPFKGYIWPAKGVLTSGYGWRWGRMHKGIDIAAPVGTPIVAVADGEVISAGWNSGGYGNLVKLKHDDGSITLYAHNSKILVRRGQKVEQGQHIANMGSTGFSTGPHLHFEVHPQGIKAVDPIAFLPSK
jgi:murein DD-endopeptidase MepM/ murein hydrolase activator NlpD